MSDTLYDALMLVIFSTMIFGIAGLGILTIPWTDDELSAVSDFVRSGLQKVDDGLQKATNKAEETITQAGKTTSFFLKRYWQKCLSWIERRRSKFDSRVPRTP